jgi:hypothetical protein
MVKITLDPMPQVRLVAKDRINQQFATKFQDSYRHVVHARKREIAALVKAGQEPTAEFIMEANIRMLTVQEFADIILSKISDLDKAELERQRLLSMIDSASTIEELKTIVGGEL